MKKKLMTLIVVCMMLMLASLNAVAANKNTAAHDAYMSYMKANLSSQEDYRFGSYTFHDINKDGVDELFFTYALGVRSGVKVYTYKNNKVVSLGSFGAVSTVYFQKKKICVVTSSGAADTTFTVYTFNGKKLVKGNEYKSVSKSNFTTGKLIVNYYKNNKKISKATFDKAVAKLNKWDYMTNERL